jgi:methyltransferase (TIGR00027 family)
MDEEAWRTFEPFRAFIGPNLSNATRHRIIDDLLRTRLGADPNLRVIVVGAGFDSRAFRLTGGRWLEVDEPQVFDWKEPRLPAATCPNELTRLSVDFAAERLADRLRPFADPEPVAIVVEGVLFYLGEPRIRELLRTLRATFPRGEVLCDMMTVDFFNKFSRTIHERIRGLGTSFVLPERPLEMTFADEGYVETDRISTIRRAAQLGSLPWYIRLTMYVSSTLRDGYAIRAFLPRSAKST